MPVSEERKSRAVDDSELMQICLEKAAVLMQAHMKGLEDSVIWSQIRVDLAYKLFSSITQSENGLGAVTEKAIEYLGQLIADSKAASERSKEAFESSLFTSPPPPVSSISYSNPPMKSRGCKHPAMWALREFYRQYAYNRSPEEADKQLAAFYFPIATGTEADIAQIQCPACHQLFTPEQIKEGEIETIR